MAQTLPANNYRSWGRTQEESFVDSLNLRLPLFFAWFACGIVVLLLLFVIYSTFVSGVPTKPIFSFENYVEALNSFLFRTVIPNTIIVGFATVAVVLFFSVPLAWLLHRTNVPFRQFWITSIAIAMIVPGFLKAIGWFMLLSPKIGVINKSLMYVFNLDHALLSITNIWGVAFVQGLMLTPTMFFLLAGPVRSMDPALEEAAQVSGATTWRTIKWVSLPVLWPAILGGTIYTFMTAISIFEIAALLGGISNTPVLATELFLSTQPIIGVSVSMPRYGIAGVYGLLIAIPSVIALYYYLRVIAKGYRYAVVTGKAYRPRNFDIGRGRYWALIFIFAYFLLAVALPILMLVWASLLPYLVVPSTEALSLVTLRWYLRIMDTIGGMDVVINTIAVSVITPILVIFFSFMISWIVVKTGSKGRALMDSLAMLPHAIPGLSFAFALTVVAIILARWAPWLPLYQTIAIIVLANAVTWLSYATRISNAALLQVGRELEESAQVCGARRLGTFWWVVVPVIKPSLVFAGIWIGLLVFREISMALMLVGPRSQVMSVRIWQAWEQGNLGPASALGVVMVLVMAVLILVAQRLAHIELFDGQQGAVGR